MTDAPYDFVFVTHLPAFYKVNLYNALAKQCRVYVIFLGQSSKIRAKDFVGGDMAFDHCVLDRHDFEKRNVLRNILRLRQKLATLNYRWLVVGGWDLPEYWALTRMSPKAKNALALESSVYESNTTGIRGFIKRRFLSRIQRVFASGEAQHQLLQALQYSGQTQITLGVGIFNYQGKQPNLNKKYQGRFLTVARLAPEKNLQALLQAMHHVPECRLTIVGQGPQRELLKLIAPPNVEFLGHVPNETLASVYQQHDVFVLPSLAEPWGLVVDEALYFGLPVLASNQVGCAQDLIAKNSVGLLFDPKQVQAITQALLQAPVHYEQWSANLKKMDFADRDAKQVNAYVESLS